LSLFTVGDIVSVSLITTLAAFGLVIGNPSVEGSTVKIYSSDGEYVFELAQKDKKGLEGPLGITIVEHSSEGVRISKSPCTKQICVLQGSIHYEGEIIACVPNRVVVTVIGKNKAYDAMSR
jgi:hypothetical protein|tara:strand:+ start:1052 stop:1414 length:363 start_codon:yes stop_codon:yes gene_type:complete